MFTSWFTCQICTCPCAFDSIQGESSCVPMMTELTKEEVKERLQPQPGLNVSQCFMYMCSS